MTRRLGPHQTPAMRARNPIQSASLSSTMSASVKQSMKQNPVAWWLFGCTGMLATTMTVGAAAGLTRSGSSLLYWRPRSRVPPRSDEEWEKAFEAYRSVTERHQRHPMVPTLLLPKGLVGFMTKLCILVVVVRVQAQLQIRICASYAGSDDSTGVSRPTWILLRQRTRADFDPRVSRGRLGFGCGTSVLGPSNGVAPSP